MALVRSCLEYCSPVWSGTSQSNITLLERVQRAATRYILYVPHLNYKERLIELRLLPLTFRRDFLDLCMFFKCIDNLYDFNISKHATFTSVNLQYTRAVNRRFNFKNSYYKDFYLSKIVF